MRIALLVSLLITPALSLSAQEKPLPISIHVREVHRQPEPHENGVIIHITAVVETETVIYSVTCDAFTKPPSDLTKRNLICGSLEAGHDYNAWKYPTAISLWKPEKYTGDAKRILYTIVSEKEKYTATF
jgi:hypothetical protein